MVLLRRVATAHLLAHAASVVAATLIAAPSPAVVVVLVTPVLLGSELLLQIIIDLLLILVIWWLWFIVVCRSNKFNPIFSYLDKKSNKNLSSFMSRCLFSCSRSCFDIQKSTFMGLPPNSALSWKS